MSDFMCKRLILLIQNEKRLRNIVNRLEDKTFEQFLVRKADVRQLNDEEIAEGRCSLWISDSMEAMGQVDLMKRTGTLVLTDLYPGCRDTDTPMIAIRTPDVPTPRYFAENEEGLTPTYLEHVYRRYRQLPCDVLETARCIVRETCEADVPAFYEIYAEPGVTDYLEPLFQNREEELKYTADYRKNVYEFYEFGIWTVLWKETGEIIGRAGMTLRDEYEEPELGYIIAKPFWRRGIATEVCEAIMKYAKDELGFTGMRIMTEPANEASIGLCRKLGFTREGMNPDLKFENWIKTL